MFASLRKSIAAETEKLGSVKFSFEFKSANF